MLAACILFCTQFLQMNVLPYRWWLYLVSSISFVQSNDSFLNSLLFYLLLNNRKCFTLYNVYFEPLMTDSVVIRR